jgi:hypothetical protein
MNVFDMAGFVDNPIGGIVEQPIMRLDNRQPFPFNLSVVARADKQHHRAEIVLIDFLAQGEINRFQWRLLFLVNGRLGVKDAFYPGE